MKLAMVVDRLALVMGIGEISRRAAYVANLQSEPRNSDPG